MDRTRFSVSTMEDFLKSGRAKQMEFLFGSQTGKLESSWSDNLYEFLEKVLEMSYFVLQQAMCSLGKENYSIVVAPHVIFLTLYPFGILNQESLSTSSSRRRGSLSSSTLSLSSWPSTSSLFSLSSRLSTESSSSKSSSRPSTKSSSSSSKLSSSSKSSSRSSSPSNEHLETRDTLEKIKKERIELDIEAVKALRRILKLWKKQKMQFCWEENLSHAVKVKQEFKKTEIGIEKSEERPRTADVKIQKKSETTMAVKHSLGDPISPPPTAVSGTTRRTTPISFGYLISPSPTPVSGPTGRTKTYLLGDPISPPPTQVSSPTRRTKTYLLGDPISPPPRTIDRYPSLQPTPFQFTPTMTRSISPPPTPFHTTIRAPKIPSVPEMRDIPSGYTYVREHFRQGHFVQGHYRGDTWVNGYYRQGHNVRGHYRKK